MRKLHSLALVFTLALASLSAGQRAATPARTEAGVVADRLGRIDKLLQQYVDDDRISGAVGLVLRDGRPIYDGAVGWSDKESSIVFMMQLIPSRTDVAQKFPNVVYQALTDAPRVGTSH